MASSLMIGSVGVLVGHAGLRFAFLLFRRLVLTEITVMVLGLRHDYRRTERSAFAGSVSVELSPVLLDCIMDICTRQITIDGQHRALVFCPYVEG
jgi:hypothetical protein